MKWLIEILYDLVEPNPFFVCTGNGLIQDPNEYTDQYRSRDYSDKGVFVMHLFYFVVITLLNKN